MSDEEDYNSEEDADYVPSDGELGSEEENSGEEEDLSVLADDAGTATNASNKKTRKRKQKKNDLAPRKRKGGIRLENNAETPAEETNGDAENAELAQKIKEEEEQKKAEKEKKRANDLWSSFLTDVKSQTKASPKTPQTSADVSQPVKSSSSCPSTAGCVKTASSSSTATTPASTQSNGSSSGKITITKVFDFAGEEIKITKEVQADSKEAKAELKKQEQQKAADAAATSSPLTSSCSSSNSCVPSSAGPGLIGVKRPAGGGGLGNVLNKIGKKQKMGTLEKSKMDWDAFKKKEGIEEDLKIHNKGKDGYIERMSFLNRTDLRQFEIERDLRLSRTGKR